MNRLLSFGHGYSAQELVRQLEDGWQITGTTRNADKDIGVAKRVFPGDDLKPDILAATHLLISAGPSADGDPVLNAYCDVIADNANRFEWVGYLSTTGVYGNFDGGWVDESTPVEPTTERGKWRAAAEADWLSIPGLPIHIFRLAGIYGPGRGPFAKLRRGTARRIIKPGQVFSRIHVADIARVLIASIQRPNPGAIYNVCDSDPQPPEVVIGAAARMLDVPLPPAEPFEDAEMSPMARSFYADSKRVSNRRIVEELGVSLAYPDHISGLKAILEAESRSAESGS